MSKVQIIIPTYQSEEQIDATMQSIYQQTIGMDNIYITIVDFASTDNTYQKLLKYDTFQLGVYQYAKRVNQEYRISKIVKMLNLFSLGDTTYYMGLFPGTVLYPDCIKRFIEELEAAREENITTVICEADVKTTNGEVIHQIPLYELPHLIQSNNQIEYWNKNFCHQIIWFSKGNFCEGRHYSSQINNNLNDWYCQFYRNFNQTTLYIPEKLGCVEETYSENYLERLIKDKSIMDGFLRSFEEIPILTLKEKQEVDIRCAYLALWRTLKALQAGDKKVAEDCILFAEIFWEEISHTERYQQLKIHWNEERTVFQKMDACFREDKI